MKTKIINSLVNGIIALVPIAIISYALSQILAIIDWIARITRLELLYQKINPEWGTLIGQAITLVLVIIALLFVDFVGKKIIQDRLDNLKKRIPLYKALDGMARSIIRGVNKNAFKRAVWVQYQGRWEIGLTTCEDQEVCNVVMQFALGINGQTFPIDKQYIRDSNLLVEEVIAYKTSGGIANAWKVIKDFKVQTRLPVE